MHTVSEMNPLDQDAQMIGGRFRRGSSLQVDDRQIEVLFERTDPRVVVFGGWLTHAECDALVAAARSRMQPSLVVDPATGQFRVDPVRRSRGTHFGPGETAVIAAIEQRIARVLGLAQARQEPMQILHYDVGGEYAPHYDYFDPALPGSQVPLTEGGQRVATLVMYLNDVGAGGATVFPRLGIEVRPAKGNAVYFDNCDAHGAPESRALHAGAPVLSGEKWIATKWMRARNLR